MGYVFYIVPSLVLGATVYYAWSLTLQNADLTFKLSESNLEKEYATSQLKQLSEKFAEETKNKDQFFKEVESQFNGLLSKPIDDQTIRNTYQYVYKSLDSLAKQYKADLENCNKEKGDLKTKNDKTEVDLKAAQTENGDLRKKSEESTAALTSLKAKFDELEQKIMAQSTPAPVATR